MFRASGLRAGGVGFLGRRVQGCGIRGLTLEIP